VAEKGANRSNDSIRPREITGVRKTQNRHPGQPADFALNSLRRKAELVRLRNLCLENRQQRTPSHFS
jgi:hypothetical protein